jgi:glycosyltransferase EpsF
MDGMPERILHIVSKMDRGGAEMLIMNIYRNMDREKIQFDFITHSLEKGDFDAEIVALGGRIYPIPSLGESGPIKYIQNLREIMNSSNYLALHSHTDFQSGFPALAGKLCGIKRRIVHSHSSNWNPETGMKSKVILNILKRLIKLTATDFCSCSQEAAAFLFGPKMTEYVSILKNGIDIGSFLNSDSRDCVLEELQLPKETKIIGHVGRFSPSKNQMFILKVLKKITETDPNYSVVFAGDGPLLIKVKDKAESMGLLNNTRFLGVRTDIPRLMKAFDVFLFPSLFEGFGIVTLEAQSTGTPCVISDTVPKSTDMGLNLVSYLSLDEDVTIWAEKIKKAALLERPDAAIIKNQLIKHGFSIQENISQWLNLYLRDTQKHRSLSLDMLTRSR